MHLSLLIVTVLVSFFSNWQFAFQLTYVNTSVRIFYNLVSEAYSYTNQCSNCTIPYSSWSFQWSIIIASFYPGTVVGILLVPPFVSRFGVRWSLSVTCIPAIFGSLLQLGSLLIIHTGNIAFVAALCVGRFLVGIQAGTSLCLLPIFIIEISPLRYRGRLSSFQQVSQSLSTVIGFVVGSEHLLNLGQHRFELLQFIALLPSLLFLLTLLALPETPRHYFLRTGDILRGGKAMTFYCGETDAAVIGRELQDEIKRMQYGKFDTNSIVLKGLIIGCLAALSFAFTADDVIDTFSAHILHSSSQSHWTTSTDFKSDLITVFLGVVLFVSSIFGTILIDRVGRRSLLIFGLIGTSISNSIAVLTLLFNSSVAVTIAFTLTKCFIGLGAGAPAWFLTSELVPPTTTFLYQAISTGILLIATGAVSLSFLKLEFLIGFWSILVVASGPALLSAVLLYLFLPDTKGKPYYQVRSELSAFVFSGIQKPKKYQKFASYGSADSEDTVIFL